MLREISPYSLIRVIFCPNFLWVPVRPLSSHVKTSFKCEVVSP